MSLAFSGWTAALTYCCQEDFLPFFVKLEKTEIGNIRQIDVEAHLLGLNPAHHSNMVLAMPPVSVL